MQSCRRSDGKHIPTKGYVSFAKLVIFFGMYKSTVKKAQIVRGILSEYYEEGRQDRCKMWVYRNKVAPALGISERTFFRYLNTPENTDQGTQLTLKLEFRD